MPEELPNNQTHDVHEENHLTKELQKLLSQRPELQEWRDVLVAEQTETGKQAGQKYSSLSSQENLSKFFVSLPHSIRGWMIRTLSPENALLQIDARTLEIEQRPYVVIDPFRIGSL